MTRHTVTPSAARCVAGRQKTHWVAEPERRAWLRCSGRAGLLAALAGIGLLPIDTWADAAIEADANAFAATSMAAVFEALGGRPAEATDIEFALPDKVENGALVPVTITSHLPGTQALFIVAELNPNPLAVRFNVPEGTVPFVHTRIKLARSGTVYAAVRAQGRLYALGRDVRVDKGGCGG
jgi:sulfur-oxidizing protein SoxY